MNLNLEKLWKESTKDLTPQDLAFGIDRPSFDLFIDLAKRYQPILIVGGWPGIDRRALHLLKLRADIVEESPEYEERVIGTMERGERIFTGPNGLAQVRSDYYRFIFIDGNNECREDDLSDAWNSVKRSAIVGLHDANRAQEMAIIKKFILDYPNIVTNKMIEGRGFAWWFKL